MEELESNSITSEDGFITLYLIQPDKVKAVPEGLIDNGNGTVTIDADFPLSNGVANALNLNSITIKAGVYTIDYNNNNNNNQFGEVIFDVETN